MGLPSLWIYGEDINSAIEAAEKLIEKIKSGKANKKTFAELAEVSAEIAKYANSDENKN